jgi:hypothetical protein
MSGAFRYSTRNNSFWLGKGWAPSIHKGPSCNGYENAKEGKRDEGDKQGEKHEESIAYERRSGNNLVKNQPYLNQNTTIDRWLRFPRIPLMKMGSQEGGFISNYSILFSSV